MPTTALNALRQYFSRSTRRYHEHARLQRRIAAELAEWLPRSDEPLSILELGCGSGFLTRQIVERFPQAAIDAIDISAEMIELARQRLPAANVRWQVADMNRWESPLRYDLIASSTALHWGDPLQDLVMQVRRQLRPGGRLAAAVMSAGTLTELHELRRQIAPHKKPLRQLPREADLLDWVDGAGLTLVKATTETTRQVYTSALELVRSLRQTGFTGGPFSQGSGGGLVRSELEALIELYQQRYGDPSGKVFATYRVTFVEAQKK